jgi:hypothetical protein
LTRTRRSALVGAVVCLAIVARAESADFAVLQPKPFADYIERFNATDAEIVTNHISNRESWAWLRDNIPFFECPDREVEQTYYFRWWSYRKHLVKTPAGYIVTEFLPPVSHAGAFNSVSCATGLHIAEGRWLRNGRYLDDYTRFWLRGHGGKPQPHFHKFSSWLAAAAYDRYLVTGDKKLLVDLLPDLVADYRVWETERQTTNGLFWQFDVRDGMEESISGARRAQNIRPTINSYMFANARAIANIARLANQPRIAAEFSAKADALQQLTLDFLWDSPAQFFKVRWTNGVLADVREELGFIPWMFHLPPTGKGYEAAWAQLTDARGFQAPFGITTAERRHPAFRSNGFGTCEWDGAIWPFATSQTLHALGNVLRDYPQSVVTRRDYFDAFITYTRSQRMNGGPFIGEYLDETTGDWINRNTRSAHYNHSTYADLLITGLIGLNPRADGVVEVSPLLPEDGWNYFCLDGVRYHNHALTLVWDRDGSRYGRGAGLTILINGKVAAQSANLAPLTAKLP